MSGAYTAKPAADTTPDVPSGWNIDWPFPGPFPPGYIPELSFIASGPTEIMPDDTASGIEFKLADHDTYVTQEPSESLTYTATRKSDSSEVQMKFSGGSEFFASLSDSYSDVGDDFWGGTADIIFDIDASDIGDTIVLTATSEPLNQSTVTQTHEIDVVVVYTWIASLTVVHTPHPDGDDPGPNYTNCRWQARFGIDGGDSTEQRGSAWVNAGGASRTDYESEYGDFTVTLAYGNKETFKIGCDAFIDDTYTIKLGSSYVANTIMTIDMTLVMYGSGGQEVEYTKNTEWPIHPSGAWDWEDWLTIDGGTGEVTVINS